jgi:hypothetical protein
MINLGRFWERKPQVEKINIEIPDRFLLDVLKEVQNKFGFNLPLIINTSFLKQYIIEKLIEQNVKVESLEDLRNWLLNQEESFWTNLLEFHNRRILILGLGGLSLASLFFYLGNRFVPLFVEKKEETEESLFEEIVTNLKSFISNIDGFNLKSAKISSEEESSSLEIYFFNWNPERISLKENGTVELIAIPLDKTKKVKYDERIQKLTFRFKINYLDLEIPQDVEVETLSSEFLGRYVYLNLDDSGYLFNYPYIFKQFYRVYFRLKKGDLEILISVPIPSYNQDLFYFDEKERKLRIPILILDNPIYQKRLRYNSSHTLEVFALKLSEEKSGILFLITKLWYLLRERERSEKIRKV